MDGDNETNSRFPRLCERALKTSVAATPSLNNVHYKVIKCSISICPMNDGRRTVEVFQTEKEVASETSTPPSILPVHQWHSTVYATSKPSQYKQ
jgi:hypothetical protein